MFEDVEEEVDLLLDEESSESSTELSDEAIDHRRSNVGQVLKFDQFIYVYFCSLT